MHAHVSCRTVFDTLYMLLAFGHESAEAAARLDPPGSTFRIRLVCVLLSACGAYFCKGSAARRLDRFLAFLQRYMLAKPPLPLDVEFDVQARTCISTLLTKGLRRVGVWRPGPLAGNSALCACQTRRCCWIGTLTCRHTHTYFGSTVRSGVCCQTGPLPSFLQHYMLGVHDDA